MVLRESVTLGIACARVCVCRHDGGKFLPSVAKMRLRASQDARIQLHDRAFESDLSFVASTGFAWRNFRIAAVAIVFNRDVERRFLATM